MLEQVQDGARDRIVVNREDLVDPLACDGEGQLAGHARGQAIRDRVHALQAHAFALGQRAMHGIGSFGLDADDPNVGVRVSNGGGDPRHQPAAADADEHGVQLLDGLEQLEPDRALPGDDGRIIVRMHEGQATLGLQLAGALVGGIVVASLQDDLRAQLARGLHLRDRRVLGHADQRVHALIACRQGHALCVVAGRGADDAGLALVLVERVDLVVGAANLERARALQVLELEMHLGSRLLAQRFRVHGGRCLDDASLERVGEHLASLLDVLDADGRGHASSRPLPPKKGSVYADGQRHWMATVPGL